MITLTVIFFLTTIVLWVIRFTKYRKVSFGDLPEMFGGFIAAFLVACIFIIAIIIALTLP